MDDVDRRIVNSLQKGFPLSPAPYDEAAMALGISAAELRERIGRMLVQGTLTRFGPLFQIERMGGEFLLAAMKVPADAFDKIADLVNARPEVAHNYEREHALNMWFVVAAESPAQVEAVVQGIEDETGLRVHRFPKEREYFVGMELVA